MESDEESDFIGFSTPIEKNNEEVAEAIALAKQLHVYKPGIEFVPGSKLEVLDARDNNWYLCKVVEVDWGELDILVHYEKWSIRFDEWLKMDSTRIRPSKLNARETKKIFNIKEKVLAFWAPDGRYYSAEVIKQLSEECWSVLFYDGFTRSLKQSHIRKLGDEEKLNPTLETKDYVEVKPVSKPPPKQEPVSPKIPKLEEQYGNGSKNNIFDIRIMEEKRKSKRNPDVEKLFQSMRKRKRSDRDDEEEEEVYSKPKKRIKPTKQDVVDLDSSSKSSDDESTASDFSDADTNESSDSDSSDNVDSCSNTVPQKKTPIKIVREDISSETINIGDLGGAYKQDKNDIISCNVSPTSTSSEEFGFIGFDEASLSEGKTRVKETISSLLGLHKKEKKMKKESHLCPKKGCGKSFRKENFLTMHMRHYHRKLIKPESSSTPMASKTRYSSPAKDGLDDVKLTPRNPQIELKKLQFNAITTEDGKIKSDSKISAEENSIFFSSLKRKSVLGKNTQVEFRNRKNRKGVVSESLNESDLKDFSAARTRNSKRKGPTIDKVGLLPVEIEESTDSLDKSDTVENGDPDAIINCRCGFREEDGLMLQCDICLCWQHGSCYQIESEQQVPNSYICSICENSYLQRPSMRFRHHQEWLKEGRLPRFSGSEGSTSFESMIRTCHELMGNVLSVSDVMHSLDLKLYISKRDDHPKLVMWHKKWKDEDSAAEECASFEGTGRDKVVGTRDERDMGPSDIGDHLQHIDRLGGLRINGASAQKDNMNGAIKSPFDENEDSFSNCSTSDQKPSLDKLELLKFNNANQSSVEVLHDDATEKEAIMRIDSKRNEEAGCSETKEGNFSNWKNPPLDIALTHKIKVEIEEENEDKTATGRETLESQTKEDLNLEASTFSKGEPLHDDHKEVMEEDFDINLPCLDTNGSPDLAELLIPNVEFEQFVHQASTELAPMDSQLPPVMQRAPIIPQAERILPVKCKLNLLDHIEKMQNRLFDRFDFIEDHLQDLEGKMGLTSKFSKEEEEMLWKQTSENRDEITLQARSLVRMSLKDLETAAKLISYKAS